MGPTGSKQKPKFGQGRGKRKKRFRHGATLVVRVPQKKRARGRKDKGR